jgi:hypothetical protein
MHSLITWIAYGLATLFFAACAVAWWEHLGREGRRAEEPDWEAPPRKAVSVDVELEAPAVEAGAGDVGERRLALGGAISRMANGDRRQGFGDTAPMILAGAAPDAPHSAPQDAAAHAPPVERRQRDRATASD